jgi:hypothetical protein
MGELVSRRAIGIHPIPEVLTESHDQRKGWTARRLSVDL